MTDEQLRLAAFVFQDELEQWKLVKFRFDNVHAIRSCGEVHVCKDEDDARNIAKQRAAKQIIAHYHSEMAKAGD